MTGAPTTGAGRLRIAQIGTGAIEIPPKAYGAVEEYIANLARELGRLGHIVTVLNRVPAMRSARAREIVSAAALAIELRGVQYDILHAHSPITAEALRTSRHPYVFTSHSRYWLPTVGRLDQLRRRRDEAAVRQAAAVIALNPSVAVRFRELRSGRPGADLVEYIPFGVDAERFRPAEGPTAGVGVVGLGVVTPHKRYDIFAAAARKAGAPARLIGRLPPPALRKRLLELDPELDLLGEVPASVLPRELANGRVFVHPSDMELASVATVQAMACGLPVVGSDLLDGIVTEGVDGFLVDHRRSFDERVEESADRIGRLLSDPILWSRMSAKAREAAVDHHAWPSIARQVSDLYGRVLTAS